MHAPTATETTAVATVTWLAVMPGRDHPDQRAQPGLEPRFQRVTTTATRT
jgi:hypothetical protein